MQEDIWDFKAFLIESIKKRDSFLQELVLITFPRYFRPSSSSIEEAEEGESDLTGLLLPFFDFVREIALKDFSSGELVQYRRSLSGFLRTWALRFPGDFSEHSHRLADLCRSCNCTASMSAGIQAAMEDHLPPVMPQLSPRRRDGRRRALWLLTIPTDVRSDASSTPSSPSSSSSAASSGLPSLRSPTISPELSGASFAHLAIPPPASSSSSSKSARGSSRGSSSPYISNAIAAEAARMANFNNKSPEEEREKEKEKEKVKGDFFGKESFAKKSKGRQISSRMIRVTPLGGVLSGSDSVIKSLGCGLLDVPVKAMGAELVRQDAVLLLGVSPRDLLTNLAKFPACCWRGLSRMVEHFQLLSQWVATEVLSMSSIEHGSALLGYFIRLARELLDANDFSAAYAIVGALGQSALQRLRRVFDGVKSKRKGEYEDLQALFSPMHNYAAYRKELQRRLDLVDAQAIPFVVPYVGLIVRDLVVAEEVAAVPEFAPEPLRPLHRTASQLWGLQQRLLLQDLRPPTAPLRAQTWLEQRHVERDEEALYARSLIVEPPIGDSGVLLGSDLSHSEGSLDCDDAQTLPATGAEAARTRQVSAGDLMRGRPGSAARRKGGSLNSKSMKAEMQQRADLTTGLDGDADDRHRLLPSSQSATLTGLAAASPELRSASAGVLGKKTGGSGKDKDKGGKERGAKNPRSGGSGRVPKIHVPVSSDSEEFSESSTSSVGGGSGRSSRSPSILASESEDEDFYASGSSPGTGSSGGFLPKSASGGLFEAVHPPSLTPSEEDPRTSSSSETVQAASAFSPKASRKAKESKDGKKAGIGGSHKGSFTRLGGVIPGKSSSSGGGKAATLTPGSFSGKSGQHRKKTKSMMAASSSEIPAAVAAAQASSLGGSPYTSSGGEFDDSPGSRSGSAPHSPAAHAGGGRSKLGRADAEGKGAKKKKKTKAPGGRAGRSRSSSTTPSSGVFVAELLRDMAAAEGGVPLEAVEGREDGEFFFGSSCVTWFCRRLELPSRAHGEALGLCLQWGGRLAHVSKSCAFSDADRLFEVVAGGGFGSGKSKKKGASADLPDHDALLLRVVVALRGTEPGDPAPPPLIKRRTHKWRFRQYAESFFGAELFAALEALAKARAPLFSAKDIPEIVDLLVSRSVLRCVDSSAPGALPKNDMTTICRFTLDEAAPELEHPEAAAEITDEAFEFLHRNFGILENYHDMFDASVNWSNVFPARMK